MIRKLVERPALPLVLLVGIVGVAATLAAMGGVALCIRALRELIAESYDEGRVAGIVTGARLHDDGYQSALPGR